MCGRFVGRFSFDDLTAEIVPLLSDLGGGRLLGEMESFENYNVAPTQLVPVLRAGSERPDVEVEMMRWGLVPNWSKDPRTGQPLINARSETVTEKPSFRNLVPRHRCAIPMTGFYEWDRSDPGRKVPYFVARTDGRLMWSIGLWNRPAVLEGRASATMLTCASTGPLADIHDRSPVHLAIEDALTWVLAEHPPLGLVGAPEIPQVTPRRVSERVNSIRHNGPELLDPHAPDAPRAADEDPHDPPRLF